MLTQRSGEHGASADGEQHHLVSSGDWDMLGGPLSARLMGQSVKAQKQKVGLFPTWRDGKMRLIPTPSRLPPEFAMQRQSSVDGRSNASSTSLESLSAPTANVRQCRRNFTTSTLAQRPARNLAAGLGRARARLFPLPRARI